MSIKVIWHCDGCDDKKDMSGSGTSDWKTVKVCMEGVDGYPLWKGVDKPEQYQLCPSCIRRLHDGMSPRSWPRVEKANPQ